MYVFKKETVFPEQLVSTVWVENEYSRKMMLACGFQENQESVAEFILLIDDKTSIASSARVREFVIQDYIKKTQNTTFAYLFGIDLLKNEFIWLNQARNSNAQVAGNTPLAFLLDYFHVTEIFSVYDFFELMAEEMVEDLFEAEIVVTDHETVCANGAEIIREYDFERQRALMG